MASKTWKELLGSCTYMCGVDGTDICRYLGYGRYVRLWSFDTTEQAIEALKAWREELGEDGPIMHSFMRIVETRC